LLKLFIVFLSVFYSTTASAAFVPGFELQGTSGFTSAYSGKTFTDPTTGMEFVFVPGGCYQMGDTIGDGVGNEKPVHEVCVDDYYLGKYEVTQDQYQKITGSNPSKFRGGNHPVGQVSWHDAQDYLRKLNSRSNQSYRLPTEAEWEYAARSGGKDQIYSGGNNIDAVAWYDSNSGNQTHLVGQKQTNGLGLYDMTGNVWEWCQDWYGKGYYAQSSRTNPQGPGSGADRVYRGGSWNFGATHVRSALRNRNWPGIRNYNLGFRLVLPSVQ